MTVIQCQLKRLKHLISHVHMLKSMRSLSTERSAIVLGIESSCDDTGCGIVDNNGNILGEAINSQHLLHLKHGGIIPTIAKEIHRTSITEVCENALKAADLKLKDIDAIATTVKPGLPMSLQIGRDFGVYLARIGKKPFIPIHHMQAHALTVRMTEKVDYPFLVLLVSGGHCLLAVVENVDKFYLLGSTIDHAPGEVFDKIARRLKLQNIPEFAHLNGGQAIETAASKATDPRQFEFQPVMTAYYDCQFSFAGISTACGKYILNEEKEHDIVADMIIPNVYNLCASFQLAMIKHICQRTQRAIEFVNETSLIPEDKRTLVVSGGVACNNFLAKALNIVCAELGYRFVRTPPRFCTDNGVMVAWNGMERWIANAGVIRNESEIEKVAIEKRALVGEDWINKVKDARLKCKWIRLEKQLF